MYVFISSYFNSWYAIQFLVYVINFVQINQKTNNETVLYDDNCSLSPRRVHYSASKAYFFHWTFPESNEYSHPIVGFYLAKILDTSNSPGRLGER